MCTSGVEQAHPTTGGVHTPVLGSAHLTYSAPYSEPCQFYVMFFGFLSPLDGSSVAGFPLQTGYYTSHTLQHASVALDRRVEVPRQCGMAPHREHRPHWPHVHGVISAAPLAWG